MYEKALKPSAGPALCADEEVAPARGLISPTLSVTPCTTLPLLASDPEIDPRVFDSLKTHPGGDVLLRNLASRFISDGEASVTLLRDAIIDGDVAELRRGTRALKSVARFAGVRTLVDACGWMELAISAGAVDEQRKALAVVEAVFMRARSALPRLIEELLADQPGAR